MKDMLDKVLDASWTDQYDSIEDLVIEQCQTYGQLGELITKLLQAFGGTGDVDDRAVALAADLFAMYLEEFAPQPPAELLEA